MVMRANPTRSGGSALALSAALLLACKATPAPALAAPEERPVAEAADPRPPEVSEAPSPDSAPAPRVELDGFGERERAALSERWMKGEGYGRIIWARSARLIPGATAFGDPDVARLDRGVDVTLVEDGDEPRVAIRQGGVRLLVHVSPGDLQPLVVKPFALRPRPAARLRASRVEVGSGESLTIDQREGDWVEVRVDRTPLAGWAPAQSVGAFHDQTPFGDDGYETAEYATVTRKVALLDEPGGRPLIEIPAVAEVRTLGRSGNHLLISYVEVCASVDVRFTGYVPRSAVGPSSGGLGMCGRGMGRVPRSFGKAQDYPRRWSTPGTLLLAPDSNRVVGCASSTAEVATGDDGVVFVDTIWGPVEVRPAPPGVEERCYAEPDAKPPTPSEPPQPA